MTFDPLVGESHQSHVKVSPHVASQSPAPPIAVSAYQREGAGPLPVVRAAGRQLACGWSVSHCLSRRPTILSSSSLELWASSPPPPETHTRHMTMKLTVSDHMNAALQSAGTDSLPCVSASIQMSAAVCVCWTYRGTAGRALLLVVGGRSRSFPGARRRGRSFTPRLWRLRLSVLVLFRQREQVTEPAGRGEK